MASRPRKRCTATSGCSCHLCRFNISFAIDVPWVTITGRESWTYELTAVVLWSGGHFVTLVPTASEGHDFFLFDCLSKQDKKGNGIGNGQRYVLRDAMRLLRAQRSQLWLYNRVKQVSLL